jgi:hypothetical protein
MVSHEGTRATKILGRAVLGSVAMLVVGLLPSEATSEVTSSAALLGLWLCVSSLIGYAESRRPAIGSVEPQRPLIPIRFDGPLGAFSLRPRGDGRLVQIISSKAVVAEVQASDFRDEIRFLRIVAPGEAEDFGSALGQAIEMASAAEEAHMEWDDHSTARHDWRQASASW